VIPAVAIIDSCQGAQENSDRYGALAVELQNDVIALARFELHPGAAVWNEFSHRQ
jgi:hypothetical protein